jgi:hypothetical protein
MLTSPWFDVITKLEERLGIRSIKAGPAGNGMGDKGFMDRRSYTLTKGSGTGRDCLGSVGDVERRVEQLAHLRPQPMV